MLREDITTKYRRIDFGKYADAQQLQEIGPEMIKQDLQRTGIKCWDTLEERANRLLSTKGINTKAQINKKFLVLAASKVP